MNKLLNILVSFLLLVFLVFIFTMPGYNCSIKDRMLYASARNAVIGTIENFGIEVEKKVSI